MSQEKWIKKYKNSVEIAEDSVDILTGFNANIDVIHQLSDLDLDISETESRLVEELSSIEDLKASLKHCVENNENNEVDIDNLDIQINGDEYIGGQGGIISNFLAGTGNGVIFYTPLLSEELASKINEKVLYPVIDGEFMLKNVRDASNTDRTKKNHIFEFSNEDETGRLIVSDTLKGFGPYFRKGIEDNLELIQQNIDCVIFSGFHDIEGNKEAKLKKSAQQLHMINKPIHLEYVDKKTELTTLILKHILPEIDSLGLDETEFRNLRNLLDINSDNELSLGEAFNTSKKIINRFNIDRIHLHTYRYHLTVTVEDYPHSAQNIRESMLYGELAAIQTADTGQIPEKDDIKKFNMNDKEINGLQELDHFEDFFELPDFADTGIAEIDGFKVVAIPTIIHHDPERTVGMGDVISSGAFSSEFS